MHGASAQRA